MKTVKFIGNNEVEVADVEDPVVGDGEVLVRIQVSALCGSELPALQSPRPFGGNPGHEAAGIVVDPNGAAELKAGDRVGFYPPHGCGTCQWCKQDLDTYCPNRASLNNLHAELASVPARALVPLPDDVPMDAAVLLVGDGLGVPFHVAQQAPVAPEDMVVVIGCGPIGLGNILVQKHFGAKTIAIDKTATRLELARDFGADHAIDLKTQDPTEIIAGLTDGFGAARVIVCTGARAGFETGLKNLANGGTLIMLGALQEVTINPVRDLLLVDKTVMGSFFYPRREFPDIVAMFRNGFPVGRLVTHRFPFPRADAAYALFAAGETGKVLLLHEW